MQEQKNTSRYLIENKAILCSLLAIAAVLPLVNIDNYLSLFQNLDIDLLDSINLRLIVSVGIIVNGVVSMVINYNILKVVYMLAKYKISKSLLFAQYVSSVLTLSLVIVIFPNVKIDNLELVKNQVIVVFVYFTMFTIFNRLNSNTEIKKGLLGTGLYVFITSVLLILFRGVIEF